MGKNIFREYSIFTSPLYRLVMWLLIPVCQIGGAFVLKDNLDILRNVGLPQDDLATGMIVFAILLPAVFSVFIEPLSDIFFMKSVERKKIGGMVYLNSSSKGRGFFESAVIIDALRKLLVNGSIFLVMYFGLFDGMNLDICRYVAIFITLLGFLCLGLYLSRMGGTFMITMLVSILLLYAFAGYIVVSFMLPGWVDVLAIVLSCVVIVFYFYDINKKLERSYFDE